MRTFEGSFIVFIHMLGVIGGFIVFIHMLGVIGGFIVFIHVLGVIGGFIVFIHVLGIIWWWPMRGKNTVAMAIGTYVIMVHGDSHDVF